VGVSILLDLVWPLVASLVAHSERLLHHGSVLGLLDVIELISQAHHVLSLDHLVHMLRPVSLLSEGVVPWHIDCVIDGAWMDLFQPWLVLEAFPELLDVLWCPRSIIPCS
jgi:hypothetical protein